MEENDFGEGLAADICTTLSRSGTIAVASYQASKQRNLDNQTKSYHEKIFL